VETLPILGFENPVASWLHFAGAIAFALLLPRVFAHARGRPERISAFVVFGIAVLAQLLVSATYHLLPMGATRTFMQQLDHAIIFVLIAASFTPPHVTLFRGVLRYGALAFVWTGAVLCVLAKIFFFDEISEGAALVMYLSLGWVGALTGFFVVWRYGLRSMSLLLVGGLAYTAGGVLEYLRWPLMWSGVIGPHELFHFAVLVGIGAHWAQFWKLLPHDHGPPIQLFRGAFRRGDPLASLEGTPSVSTPG